MDRKASVLMITLWILAILAILAIGLGNRASFTLRLSRYQMEKLQAHCLAKAGIQKAIAELLNDQNGYDSFNETWSTGRDSTDRMIFENVEINERSGDTFNVKYLYDKEKNKYLCMLDEERRINLNTAPKELLKTLLIEAGLQEEYASQVSDYIRIWRGDNDPVLLPAMESAKNFKRSEFVNQDELQIILEFFYQNRGDDDYRLKARQLYEKLKDLIAVYPAGKERMKININTVEPQVLRILINTSVLNLRQKGETVNIDPALLSNMIMEYRQNNIFLNTELEAALGIVGSGPGASELLKVINELKKWADVKSHNFRIISTGKTAANNTTYSIECIFNRDNGIFVYWHEN